MFGLGGQEILLLLVLGVLLFGRKLPELGRSVGKTMVEFKKGMKGLEDEVEGTVTSRAEPPPAIEQPRPPQRDAPLRLGLVGRQPPHLVAHPHLLLSVLVLPDRVDARRAPPVHPLCAALPPLRRAARTHDAPPLAPPSQAQGYHIPFVRRRRRRSGSYGGWCGVGSRFGCGWE